MNKPVFAVVSMNGGLSLKVEFDYESCNRRGEEHFEAVDLVAVAKDGQVVDITALLSEVPELGTYLSACCRDTVEVGEQIRPDPYRDAEDRARLAA
ncbi:MAG: hypothetical protein EG825_00275 [Rhodocyclaceae bacterium]|nr:hypothetical protein [Rhodocyclaceae bacterium]